VSVSRAASRMIIDHLVGRRQRWSMIDRANPHLGSHPLRHELLSLWVDHTVFCRNQEPGRFRFPTGFRRRLLNAADRKRPLHRLTKRLHFFQGVLGESVLETFIGHQNQTVSVRLQMGSLRVRWFLIEYLSYGSRPRREQEPRRTPAISPSRLLRLR
jgi:hypothetical protein